MSNYLTCCVSLMVTQYNSVETTSTIGAKPETNVRGVDGIRGPQNFLRLFIEKLLNFFIDYNKIKGKNKH